MAASVRSPSPHHSPECCLRTGRNRALGRQGCDSCAWRAGCGVAGVAAGRRWEGLAHECQQQRADGWAGMEACEDQWAWQSGQVRSLGRCWQRAARKTFKSLGREGRCEQGFWSPWLPAWPLVPLPSGAYSKGWWWLEAVTVKGLPCCSVHRRESQPGFGERGEIRDEWALSFRTRAWCPEGKQESWASEEPLRELGELGGSISVLWRRTWRTLRVVQSRATQWWERGRAVPSVMLLTAAPRWGQRSCSRGSRAGPEAWAWS